MATALVGSMIFIVFEGELVGGGIWFALFCVFGGDDGTKVFFDVMSRDDGFDVGPKGLLQVRLEDGLGYFFMS